MPRVIRINHIGLATESISDALRVFGDGLGMEIAGGEVVPGDNVRVLFAPVGESRFEFLEPVGDEGPVHKFLEKRGPGIHHICLEVEDLRGMLDHLSALGVELIDSQPRPGAHGTMVAFVHPKSANGVLIELVETHPDSGSNS
ncbi:MAG TPA: methylmalonyl-CoA epimerase [Chloroflexia bacterium]|nr:methylmalonyl-CoA epimerase [Chloroflexia bacterium]